MAKRPSTPKRKPRAAHDTPFDPPKVEAGTGVALIGDYPANHRLRSEALAAAGEATDAGGIVTDAQIAEAGERLAADAEGEKLAEQERAEREAAADDDDGEGDPPAGGKATENTNLTEGQANG